MDIFTAIIGLMDDTIIAMLKVRLLSFFLIGALVVVGFAIFVMASNMARGRRV